MGIHTTKYKTENGKTRKVKGTAAKTAGSGAQVTTGADKNDKPGSTAK
jgi:hypothetical protein